MSTAVTAMVDEGLLTGESLEALEDLLDEVTQPSAHPVAQKSHKAGAVPLKRTPAQIKASEARAAAQRAADDLRVQQDAAKARAAQLAQIVNLHIAGFSLADIGVSIGASEAEIERLLANETQFYVRNQASLRTYVRNYVSGKYTSLLETVWDRATDASHEENLEAQDRALRILDRMARLHGAEAPTQSEIKVDAAPEAVDRLVNALSKASGMGYDVNVFDVVQDIVDGEVVEDAVVESTKALESASQAVEEPQEGDEDGI